MDMGYEYDMIHEFFCHHYKGRLKMNPAKQLFTIWYYENEKEVNKERLQEVGRKTLSVKPLSFLSNIATIANLAVTHRMAYL